MDLPHAALLAHVVDEVIVFAALANKCHQSCLATPGWQCFPSSRPTAPVDVPCPCHVYPSVVEVYPLQVVGCKQKILVATITIFLLLSDISPGITIRIKPRGLGNG